MENIYQDHEKSIKELTSDFNEAKFQIYRLHILWLSCNSLSQEGKLEAWKWKLDTIWRELSPDAVEKDKGKDKKDTYFYEIKQLNNKIAESKGESDLYNALQEKEIFLRYLQEKVGKGSKKSYADEDEFEE